MERDVTYIDQPGNMSLDRRAAKQEIGLVVIILKPPEVLNAPQRRLAIRYGRIQIVLLALLVNAEALERQIPPGSIMRLYGSGQEQRALHSQVRHSVLHDGEFDRDDAGHFDGAAKGDFAVALGEVQVANAEFGAFDVHGEVDFAATAEVFNVAVSAVLGAAGDGSRAFFAHLGFDVPRSAARVHVLRLRGLGNDFFEFLRRVGVDELSFAAVPLGENFGRWGTAQNTRVDETRESDMGNVAGGRKDTLKVPDGFGAGGTWNC